MAWPTSRSCSARAVLILDAATDPTDNRNQDTSRPSVASSAATSASCRSTTESDTNSPASGVPMYGTLASARRIAAVRATTSLTSRVPSAMAASLTAGSDPLSAASAPRACVPRAWTWSARSAQVGFGGVEHRHHDRVAAGRHVRPAGRSGRMVEADDAARRRRAR